MRLYKTQTNFNCGIDLHSRNMYICVADKEGNILVHKNVKKNDFQYFLKLIKPFRHNLTVACECCFNWYWLCDACHKAGIPFVLGHALYMKSIHGGKAKNDKIDSEKIAHLLRTNMLPQAYAYPVEKRSTRNLLRRRTAFVWQRATLLANLSMGVMQEGQPPLEKHERRRSEQKEHLMNRYNDPMHQLSVEADTYLVEHYDSIIAKLEQTIIDHTNKHHHRDYVLLKTIPGLGKIMGLLILYEIDEINRFPRVQDFSSYSRLVKCKAVSDGKVYGTKGAKIGNGYLKYAITETAFMCRRHHPLLNKFSQKLENKHGKKVANAIMANKIGRAIYFMLRDKKGFDINKLINNKVKI